MKNRVAKALIMGAMTAMTVGQCFAFDATDAAVLSAAGTSDCAVVIDEDSLPEDAFQYNVTLPTSILLVTEDASVTASSEYHGSADLTFEGRIRNAKTLTVSVVSQDAEDAAGKVSLSNDILGKVTGDFEYTVEETASDDIKAARADQVITISTPQQKTEMMNKCGDFGISIHDVTNVGAGNYAGGLTFTIALEDAE